MNTKVALILLGFVAVSVAYSTRHRSHSHVSSEEILHPEDLKLPGHPAPATPSYAKPVEHETYSSTRGSGYSHSNTRLENEKIAEEQAKSAKYSFASAVDDSIMDQSQVRHETRDGLKVEGSYSYTDGFFKRTVKYQADENGYRVLSEESEPIGAGPQIDLVNGKADVHTQVEGVDTQYSISAHDIAVLNKDAKHKL